MHLFCGSNRFFPSAVSQKLVHLIETHAEELSRAYLRDVKTTLEMPTYRVFDETEVYVRAHRVFSQFGRWISAEISESEMESYWTALGRERREEGFALSEIMVSLCMIRRHVWTKIRDDGFLDTASDLYEAMDLYGRIVNFFDRALFYAVRGFEEKK